MSASKPSPEAGKQLRQARTRVRLSTRDVERLSQQLAHEKQNQEYYISHAWLTEIENGKFTPSIYKLYSLSIIYKRSYDEILACFEIHIGDIAREQMWLTLPRTHLLQDNPEQTLESATSMPGIRDGVRLERTNLVSQMFNQWGGLPASLLPSPTPRNSIYGYVGTEDFTLFPLIRPGSFVQIDSTQKRIGRGAWSNEHDRPIYFVELRDSYACSWCELKEGRLLLIPSSHARNQVREVRYPADAEIIGRVTAVSMRIADAGVSPSRSGSQK
jgi:transcriptional regulator with XRE-family HTH domain